MITIIKIVVTITIKNVKYVQTHVNCGDIINYNILIRKCSYHYMYSIRNYKYKILPTMI